MPATASDCRSHLIKHMLNLTKLIWALKVGPPKLPFPVVTPAHQLAGRGCGERRLAEGAALPPDDDVPWTCRDSPDPRYAS